MKRNLVLNFNFWRTTSLYGFGFLGLRLISFILVPIYTNLLTPSDTGVIFIIYTFLAFLNTLYSRGMDASLFKYFNEKDSSEVVSTSIIYSVKYGACISLLLTLFFFFCSGSLSLPFENIFILGLTLVLFCDMISSRCLNILRLLNRPQYYIFSCFFSVSISLILNIYFINFLKMGLNGAIIAIIFSALFQFFILSPVFFKSLNIRFYNSKLLYKMKKTGLPFIPAAVFLILIELADRWMIGILSPNGTADVGLYGSAYKFGSLIMLCVKGFNLNWQPYYLKGYNPVKFYKIGTLFLFFLIAMATFISLLWPLLFKFLIGPLYWKGGIIIPIISISYVFYGLFILQMPSIYLKNKENWAPVFWGSGLLVNLTCNYFLIIYIGYYGAAFSTLLSYMTMSFFLYYKNRSWMPISYNYNLIGIVFIISMAFIVFQYNFNIGPESNRVYFFSIGFSFLYLSLMTPFAIYMKNKL